MQPLDLLAVGLAAGGVFFALVAGIGVIRFPDVYSRAHAVSKTDTLGVGLVLAAAAIEAESVSVTVKILFLFGFMLVTNPTGAHVLTRSSYLAEVPAWQRGRDDGRAGENDNDQTSGEDQLDSDGDTR